MKERNAHLRSNMLRFNPFLIEFHENPYPFYRQLRDIDPVHESFLGVWVLTRYEDVKAVLRDPRFKADDLPLRIRVKSSYTNDPQAFMTLANITSKWMFFLNPPDHTRIRGLLTKVFSVANIEKMRLSIQETINGLLDKVRHQGSMNIIADFSCPLPVITIAKMLGAPTKDHGLLNRWSTALSRILDQLLPLEFFYELNSVAEQFKNYFRNLIEERKIQPQDDLISHLIAIQAENNLFTDDELLATCMVLFVTGEETVVNLIGNGMLALLQHPAQMKKLKNDRSLIKNAVEELLRYDSPLQQTARVASEDVALGGKVIKAGEKVLVSLGAANRDPMQFEEPDNLDIMRENVQHVGFGGGIHNCLGITLARVQAQLAIESLVQQLPELELAIIKPEWDVHIALRRLKALPVNFQIKQP